MPNNDLVSPILLSNFKSCCCFIQ